jgi:hypothetical protein
MARYVHSHASAEPLLFVPASSLFVFLNRLEKIPGQTDLLRSLCSTPAAVHRMPSNQTLVKACEIDKKSRQTQKIIHQVVNMDRNRFGAVAKTTVVHLPVCNRNVTKTQLLFQQKYTSEHSANHEIMTAELTFFSALQKRSRLQRQ